MGTLKGWTVAPDSDDLADEIPEPCTDAAMLAGCTCRLSAVNSASIDPPEPVLDIGCPLHGKYRPGGVDPDDEADARREEEQLRWLIDDFERRTGRRAETIEPEQEARR